MTFTIWLDRFISEKELDIEDTFEVEGPEWGWNLIPLGCVIEAIKSTSCQEQAQIKNMLVKIDFVNGNVMDYFEHLAQAIAK